MERMTHRRWINENRKILICVDSYEGGILKGRMSNVYQELESFSGLSQLLIKVESVLTDLQKPQSYTEPRAFSSLLYPEETASGSSQVRRGMRATFELQVLFRQHSSWQGLLRWQEENAEQSFRSALELVMLMDSALRSMEGSGVA